MRKTYRDKTKTETISFRTKKQFGKIKEQSCHTENQITSRAKTDVITVNAHKNNKTKIKVITLANTHRR